MGELTDHLGQIAVEVWSPDGKIGAEARGKHQISVWFAPRCFRTYREPALEHQLAQLATLVWTRYRRAYTEIVDAFLGATGRPEQPSERDDRLFQERLRQLEVTGVSPGGWVRLRSRALVDWEVALTPGAVRSLTEQEFLAELGSAVHELMSDYQARVILLTDEVYDIGIPKPLRRPGAAGRFSG